MKYFRGFAPALVLLLAAGQNFAAEKGRIAEPRVNIRAQPSMYAETITQLKQGDEVTILEEIELSKPKEGEPKKWLKIGMPANTPVWVYAPYVDLSNHSVKVSRLNLRAGPGENYSVVGRIERGAALKQIRIVEDWMEVEAPEEAYAFLAADLLEGAEKGAGATTAAAGAGTTGAGIAATEAPKPIERKDPIVPPPTLQEQQVKSDPVVAAPVKDTPVRQAQREEPARPAAPVEQAPPVITPPPQLPERPIVTTPERPSRRVVRREGIVRTTMSPHAPTYHELLSTETRKTINYMIGANAEIDLKPLRGKKVVVVGEEGIDPRWPKVPVIQVEEIFYLP